MPELLKIVADNPNLMAELRKLFEDAFSVDYLTSNQSNQLLGEKVRARIEGLECVRKAFSQIERHRSPKVNPLSTVNPSI